MVEKRRTTRVLYSTLCKIYPMQGHVLYPSKSGCFSEVYLYSVHPLPLYPAISPPPPLPYRLEALVGRWRSDCTCDTHTHTEDDRQEGESERRTGNM
jgi:hypothetical protein